MNVAYQISTELSTSQTVFHVEASSLLRLSKTEIVSVKGTRRQLTTGRTINIEGG